MIQAELNFDGPMFDPTLDGERLGRQLRAVRDFMLDLAGSERTVPEIARDLGFPECSVSARLRDLRKPRFGGYRVESRRVTPTGLYAYRLLPPIRPRRTGASIVPGTAHAVASRARSAKGTRSV
ncbi:MAG TPA: hypothetical protein VGX94_12705 [Terriglobia bacterium]|nr:hypothetical protein [Terriglobia bacterium]